MSDDIKDWLIWDARSECWWGPNRGGYYKSLTDAGLYTEKEAKEAEDFARRYPDRKERAVPLSSRTDDIERLYAALHPPIAVTGHCGNCGGTSFVVVERCEDCGEQEQVVERLTGTKEGDPAPRPRGNAEPPVRDPDR